LIFLWNLIAGPTYFFAAARSSSATCCCSQRERVWRMTEGETGSMSYAIFRFAHLTGLTLMGAGLLGVFVTDLRSRQLWDIALFAEVVRNIVVSMTDWLCPAPCSCSGRALS
jgi:hypothetical protein